MVIVNSYVNLPEGTLPLTALGTQETPDACGSLRHCGASAKHEGIQWGAT